MMAVPADRPRGTLSASLAAALDERGPIVSPLHLFERMAAAGLNAGSPTFGAGLLCCCSAMERARGRELTVSELHEYVCAPLADLVEALQESGDREGFKHLPEALLAVAHEIVAGYDGLMHPLPVERFGEHVRSHMHDDLPARTVRL